MNLINRDKIAEMVILSIVAVFILSILDHSVRYNEIFVYGQNGSPNESLLAVPSSESVHRTESLELPANIDTFIMLIVNEAHESWNNEKHKLVTDKNAYYIPSNLVVYEGTKLVFLNADAPWDTPHPQKIEIIRVDSIDNGQLEYSTGILEYTNSSDRISLSAGKYSIQNTEYDTKEGSVTVLEDNQSTINNIIVGGLYTPTMQVQNNKDNDGNSHPGSLFYYREAFKENGFDILSEYSFTYGVCDYCTGKYWPDNKSGEHTLIIYSTQQPFEEAIDKLEKLVKDNVYT